MLFCIRQYLAGLIIVKQKFVKIVGDIVNIISYRRHVWRRRVVFIMFEIRTKTPVSLNTALVSW